MTEPLVEQLNCPNCGGRVLLRAPEITEVVACGQCGSVLDISEETAKILQNINNGAILKNPLIPLGTKGTIFDGEFEVIGYLVRKILVNGALEYRWGEYLLYNQTLGYRWLTEYEGHWNKVETLATPPLKGRWDEIRSELPFEEKRFAHFQRSEPVVETVLGEFYWKIKTGDQVTLNDFVLPPRIISVENSGKEISWSAGTYVNPQEIWDSFKLPGTPPPRKGVFANQPNPYIENSRGGGLLAAILVAMGVFLYVGLHRMAKKETVFTQQFSLGPLDKETSRVTPTFELKGHTANVRVRTWANVSNSWVYLSMALINDDTDKAIDFGREIGYYHGRDSEGDWREGSSVDSVFLPEVPSGRYYMRVEPEKDPLWRLPPEGLQYSVEVMRDIPRISYLFYLAILLLVPWAVIKYLGHKFERQRWDESDHPMWDAEEDDE